MALTQRGLPRAPGASLDKAALCLPHWIEQCRWDSMHLAWTPTLPNALPVGRSRTAETYLFANSNQCEPVQHAQQTKLVFRSHSFLLSPRLSVFLPSLCGASVTLDADWIVLCSICSCPVLRLLSPLPLGEGGGCVTKEHQKKKKNVKGNVCVLGPFEISWSFNVSVKEHTYSLPGLVPTPMPSKNNKKNGG